jgi:hypothetical protein
VKVISKAGYQDFRESGFRPRSGVNPQHRPFDSAQDELENWLISELEIKGFDVK